MKVVVMGTGALGGYFGGLLARAGNDVTFVVRGRRLEQMRRDGMPVESTMSGSFRVPATFAASPAETGEADLVLFCVKSFDTDAAIEAVRPCIGPRTAILCLQNGIDNEETLANAFGADNILAGAARIEATVDDDGTIRQIGPNHRIDFGEWEGAAGERARHLLETLEAAGIDAHMVEDARFELWRKFIFLCSTAGLTAATGRTIGEVAAMPETRAVLEQAITEIFHLGRAEGIPFPDGAVSTTVAFVDTAPFQMKSSLQRDLERGRRVEIDALSGAVVRLGQRHGIPTPVHLTLLACVKARAAATD